MRPPRAVNDNGSDRHPSVPTSPERAPARLEAEVKRLLAEAERANLDALACILRMAAREASRAAEWERRVSAALKAGPGR